MIAVAVAVRVTPRQFTVTTATTATTATSGPQVSPAT